jgi:hypothetical protein
MCKLTFLGRRRSRRYGTRGEGGKIYSIHPEASIFDAVAKMVGNDIGSLIAIDEDIITERQDGQMLP